MEVWNCHAFGARHGSMCVGGSVQWVAVDTTSREIVWKCGMAMVLDTEPCVCKCGVVVVAYTNHEVSVSGSVERP